MWPRGDLKQRYRIDGLERRMLLSSGFDVALIDKTLPAAAVLERAVSGGGPVILFDGERDTPHDVLARVADWADSSGAKIRSLSLLSHASAGRFELGNEWVSKSSLDPLAKDFERLGQAMGEDSAINLFGCSLTDPLGDGQILIDRIANLAKTRVFASKDVTGEGGDWRLESASRGGASGRKPRVPFSTKRLSAWHFNLAASITVTPTSGLVTTEAGGTATFTIKLNSSPGGGGATIGLSSSDLSEGTVSPAILAFTSGNWNTPQTVTITGVDDAIGDGNIAYTIVTAPAIAVGGYSGLDASDVSVTNVDDDIPGVSFSPTSGITTEAGGTATFGVRLNAQPSANVTVPLRSSNTAEGTLSVSSLTFTSANWSTPQNVTATGVDDLVDDGDVSYSIVTDAATSTDPNYSGLNGSDASVVNADDDTAGFTITASPSPTTTEAGGTASFTVALTSKPTANVVLGITSSNTAEGTVSVSSLTFTPANWNTPQTVTATGVDDLVDDGDVAYSVVTAAASSADSAYQGMNPSDVTITNIDDDAAGITVNPTSGLVTSEAGAAATFTLVLTSKPLANVSIGISSSLSGEGTASTASVLFTAANWNLAQTVTVTGADDFIDDGDRAYSIVTAAAASTDPVYNGRGVADVSATNLDNDTAGIIVSPTSGLSTTEAGGTASFTVVLQSQPTANVTIPLSSSNAAEGTPSAASLTFTAANWNTPQTVTVTGADDPSDDGDIAYSIVTGAATSSDTVYNGLNAADVSATNVDNDTAGVHLSAPSGSTTTEAGGAATLNVVLDTKPTANVSVSLASNNTAEGTVGAASVTFTPANWNVAQSVTITGVDDAIDDGDIAFLVTAAPVSGSDTIYNAVSPVSLSFTNTDNDAAGISVTPTTGLLTTEAGGTATFTVVLDSQPLAGVSFGLSSSDTGEGTISPSSLSFTTGNWNVPRTVTITGVGESVDDGDVAYTIVTTAATSTDPLYSGRNPADVSVTNVDDDTAGITVSVTPTPATSEAGASVSFTVVLDSQPTANVSIPLTSTNTAEGILSRSSLTFTPANWNVAQSVSVTGVDDDVDDGNVVYSVATGAATSADPRYGGLDASDFAVTNTDDDTAGVIVSPTSGLTTSETGGSDTFTVVLTSRPAANVAINLSSSNAAEGTPSVAQLTFTASNWATPQTVTVTGADDDADDDNVAYSIVTSAASSSDAGYNGLAVSDVSVTNVDNDTAGFTFTPMSGLTVTEAGGSTTFTVVLNTRPSADVDLGLSSSDVSEGVVSPANVTFTAANWNVPQTVTVSGVDDFANDGNRTFTIVTAPASSADAKYNGTDPINLSVTNVDDDTAGVTVTPVAGLVTTEAGGTAAFAIRLNTAPASDVTIGISSSDTAEGTVSTASLTFTAANWNTPQTVTVTGVDDDVDDGDAGYTVVTSSATSADADFNGMAIPNVSVSNTDDDTAGVTVSPMSGLVTTEAGGTATFSVVANSRPAANITFSLTSSDTGEATLSTSSLTFTAANWNVPQVVTVTGVNDDVDDGNVAYTITTGAISSADSAYSGINPADITGSNTDDDQAGITVTPGGLVTTEAGGSTTITVVLTSMPSGSVTVPVSSSSTGEGTVSPSSLVFTTGNWNIGQTITVTGVDDSIDDGDVAYSVNTGAATSSDASYNGINPADVSLTNTDDDAAGITIVATPALVTTEAGGTASFTAVLDSKPAANVTIPLASSDMSEGTLGVSSLTFTPANWNTPQTVTVTGVDDLTDDGDVAYSVVTGAATSGDGNYSGRNAVDVGVTNIDDDTAGFTVTPTSGLVTSEAGGSANFTVVLNTRPTADVTIAIASTNPAEGTASMTAVTFTTANWNVAQTVSVTGVDDAVDDGDASYSIVLGAASSADVTYAGLNPADVSLTNNDDDVAGITVTPTSGLTTTESGGAASFAVVLTSKPTANVVVGVASDDGGEGAANVSSLTFTAANWNVSQTVTVTGVDDARVDGNVAYHIVLAGAVSVDSNYSGLNPADVALNNADDDTAGIVVTPTSGLNTTEAGATASFDLVLTSEPSANVAISVSSGNASEGTASVASVTFTPLNWNIAQSVTVTGVDDAVDDGDVAYTIVTSAATSSDGDYSGLNPSDVSLTNADDDTAGIDVTPVTGLQTTEAGGTANVAIVLQSRPTANVVIAVASSDTTEGQLSVSSLTFTPANWNTPQTITVTGVDDSSDDGDVAYSLITSAAASADPLYAGMNPLDAAITNLDDDAAGVIVTPTSGLVTSEAAATASFTIALASQPSADVTIPLASNDASEGTVSASSVTFTPANWNTPQTIVVTGVDDATNDGDVNFTVVTAPAASTDPGYAGMNGADVGVLNIDNDIAGISISPTSGLVTSEAGGVASFTVVLDAQPTAPVSIGLTTSNPGEGTVSVATLVFTPLNWNAPRTVVITGADDDAVDGTTAYSIVTTSSSADAVYNAINPSDVSVNNTDDDVAGITVAPTGGLSTTEAGGTAVFGVALISRPTADVVVPIASSDSSEGTVSTTSLTFTPANWYLPQIVTVTGVDDVVSDGDAAFSVITGAAVSADPAYNARAAADVSVINADDDVAEVHVTPVAGLNTSEAGGIATFSIVLTSQPTGGVSIDLLSSDATEGAVSISSVHFDANDWFVPKTVTVTGVDDLVQDGNVAYTIITAPAVSIDPVYNGINGANVSVVNADDDIAGVSVSPVAGLTTSEAGGTATFTVSLHAQPSANVRIDLASSRPGEATASVSRLTFTPANWNVARTVTVSGVDDGRVDGAQNYTISLSPIISADAHYNGIDPQDVAGVNADDDVVGIQVNPTGGLVTRESGAGTSFTVVLRSEPSANVTLAVASSDASEGVPSVSSLTFTPLNWNVPQQVNVAAVDDAAPDGDQAYSIMLAPAVSADADYNLLDAPDIAVTSIDDDTVGISIIPIAGISTDETGTSIQFDFTLSKQPAAGVTISLASSNLSEGIVSRSTLSFTPANWETPQRITVSGVNDPVDDGDVAYALVASVSASADPEYAMLGSKYVALVNTDDDTAGISVTALGEPTTTEAGGSSTFDVVLDTRPLGNVVLTLASGDPSEGTLANVTNTLTFNALNWNVPQQMTVTGVDDRIADGDVAYHVAVAPTAASTDAKYAGLSSQLIDLTNSDDDTAGIILMPVGPAATSEFGGTAELDIVLNSQPTEDVILSVISSDETEGRPTRSTVTFSANNWNVAQRVHVSGVDDHLLDGDVGYTVVVEPAPATADPGYVAMPAQSFVVINADDDVAAVVILKDRAVLITSESGGVARFSVVLSAQPAANVLVQISSSNSAEGEPSVTSVTFTPADWDVPKPVIVRGVADRAHDGDVRYQITVGPVETSDAAFAQVEAIQLDAINQEAIAAANLIVAPSQASLSRSGRIESAMVEVPPAVVPSRGTSTDRRSTPELAPLIATQRRVESSVYCPVVPKLAGTTTIPKTVAQKSDDNSVDEPAQALPGAVEPAIPAPDGQSAESDEAPAIPASDHSEKPAAGAETNTRKSQARAPEFSVESTVHDVVDFLVHAMLLVPMILRDSFHDCFGKPRRRPQNVSSRRQRLS